MIPIISDDLKIICWDLFQNKYLWVQMILFTNIINQEPACPSNTFHSLFHL